MTELKQIQSYCQESKQWVVRHDEKLNSDNKKHHYLDGLPVLFVLALVSVTL